MAPSAGLKLSEGQNTCISKDIPTKCHSNMQVVNVHEILFIGYKGYNLLILKPIQG